MEHNRIIQMMKPKDRVCDVFAGVGPFAIPTAKSKKSIVYANDLNPSSYTYMKENIMRNKVWFMIRTGTQFNYFFLGVQFGESLQPGWPRLYKDIFRVTKYAHIW